MSSILRVDLLQEETEYFWRVKERRGVYNQGRMLDFGKGVSTCGFTNFLGGRRNQRRNGCSMH